jgi:hypothetical protein
VDRHFRWMAEYGIHGVFLQRFVSELSVPMLLRARDTVADLVRESAEKHGRVFAIMYDVSGACPDTVCSGIACSRTHRSFSALTPRAAAAADIVADWERLSARQARSPAYLHHGGLPVLSVWGFGFSDRPDPGPARVEALVRGLRSAAYMVGGCPTHWAEGTRDSLPG